MRCVRKIFLLPVVLGAAAGISFVGLLISESDPGAVGPGPGEPGGAGVYDRTFTYYDVESVSKVLDARGISLSTPVPITDVTISQYCTYYSEESGGLVPVTYCTTSGMTDSNGITVGNLNLGGDTESPVVAIAALDPVPPLSSGRGHAVPILEGVIEGLVCDCWAEKAPGGFQSVSDWVSRAESVLADGGDAPNLKSTISGLVPGVEITLEGTAVSNGYQWTLVILQ